MTRVQVLYGATTALLDPIQTAGRIPSQQFLPKPLGRYHVIFESEALGVVGVGLDRKFFIRR